MKQILHIFRKDVRHHWIEILVSFSLVAGYGYYEVKGWSTDTAVAVGSGFFLNREFWAGFIQFLLPLVWCLLVVRVIHGESLVGDRQFWVTRSYEWPKLLASKALFVLAFVSIPCLGLQIFLLQRAGFEGTRYLLSLLWMQIMLLLTLVPVAAFATVTAGLVQLLLAILLVILYLIGMVWLDSQLPNSFFVENFLDTAQPVLLICGAVTVVLMQYARRATAKSRMLIALLCVMFFAILVATPYQYFLARQYPVIAGGRQAPFTLTLRAPGPASSSALQDNEKEVQIHLPFDVSAIQDDSIVVLNGASISIQSPDGFHWRSGWKSVTRTLFPEQGKTEIDFFLPRATYLRLQEAPVILVASIAYSSYRDQGGVQFVIPAGRFRIAGLGWCAAKSGFLNQGLQCLAPLRPPKSLLMTVPLEQDTCLLRRGESRGKAGDVSRDWIQGSESIQLGISPVQKLSVYLRSQTDSPSMLNEGLCSGTPMVLSNPKLLGSNRTEIRFDGFRLSAYRQVPLQFTFGANVR